MTLEFSTDSFFILNHEQQLTSRPDLQSSLLELDQSTSDIALEIFQAQPRETRSITCSDCIILTAKIILFPITLLSMLISWIAAKIAYSVGVGVGESKEVNEEYRRQLLELGGEEIEFMTEDEVKLEGMHFRNPHAGDNAKTILICSGSHKSYEHYAVPQVDALLKMGHHVLVFNYRGFGRSEGTASEEGFYLDAETAYQYLQSREGGGVIALGYSMGGAAATDLAAHHSDVNLFLDRSFSSMKDVASDKGTFMAKWIFQIGGASFDLKDKINQVQGRILIARGLRDETMLPYHLEYLKIQLENHNQATFLEVNSSHCHRSHDTLWFHPSSSLDATGRDELVEFLRG
jgi:fermentation-respiration switch protein FrsA (DUF1100 family)